MRSKRLAILLAVAALAAPGSGAHAKSASAVPYAWRPLADGLAYASFSFAEKKGDLETTIHAFRVDPARYRLGVVTAKKEQEGATAEEMARRERALVVINGGFFTPEHTTIGLVIKDGKILSPLHGTSWWSIFAIADDSPAIFAPKGFAGRAGVRMALQAGPRLAVDGRIPSLKENVASRSAVGVARDGQIVIAITQGSGVSFKEMARRMSLDPSRGGLGCSNAMALDGGSSSQLYAKVKKFELRLPNLSRVTNGLAVFEKKKY